MSAIDPSTPEEVIAAAIDAVRETPARRDELVALLPDGAGLYAGRTSAEVTRLRGYLLAALADVGLPASALPFVFEALESGHMPYEVAGAAIALRGSDSTAAAAAAPYLLRAVRNLSGADATVSFEGYDPRWPYARPTTALTEVLRTLGGLGAEAAAALPELERLLAQPERYSAKVVAEMQAAHDALGAAAQTCCGGEPVRETHSCCDDGPLDGVAADTGGELDTALEDQAGRVGTFAELFHGKPSVVAFFYTRCDNPYKCSLTVTKLAQLQRLVRERGLAGTLRIAAVTYDSAFDTPKRLERYGRDRGVAFDDDARFFRAISGFDELSRRFQLQVGYGPSTVNRHRIEAYLLDESGAVARRFTRLQWEPERVLEAAEELLAADWQHTGSVRATR